MPGSTNSAAWVRTQSEPRLPPPLFSRGAFAWARANLFSSLSSSLLTLLMLALALWCAAAADRVGDREGDLVGARRRRVPRASGRRLLGFHRPQDRLSPLRLLSRQPSAGASVSPKFSAPR